MKFALKWVNVARYELILKLDGALWLTIILAAVSSHIEPYGPISDQIPYFFIDLILQLLASGTCSRYIHHRFTIDLG